MAIRLTIPTTGLKSGHITITTNRRRPSSVGGNGFAIKANLKQKATGIRNSLPKSSPFQRTEQEEEIASASCLEATILELERLFSEGGYQYHPLFPQRSGPSNPSPWTDFSGRPVRVAYQGVRGSYCQEAALKAFSPICNAFPCNQMEDAFDALEDNSADRAIIPVENSIDGTIDRNYDLLLRHDQVEIVGELILPVNHCLLAIPGTCTSQLKRIVSHPQALSHCETKLQSLDLEVDEVPCAAEAAEFVSANWIADTAVIGSKVVEKEFGLEVLEQNFQDQNGNFNRFLQLGLKMKSSPQTPPNEKSSSSHLTWKTTVAFSLEKGVSDLVRALWLFESRNIRVTRVEHRPNRSNPVQVVEKKTGKHLYLDYVFILDLNANVLESNVKAALSGLEEFSSFIRVLGSYTCC